MPAVRPTRVASQVAMQQLVHGERVARAVRAQRAAAERAAAAARSEGAADGGADGGAAAHGAPGPAVQPTDRVRPAGSCLMTCAALLRAWLTPMDALAVVGRLFVSLVCCALDLLSCWATVRSSGACAVWTRAAVAACPRRGCSRQRLRRRALVSARGARRRRGGHRGAAGRRRGRGGRRAGRAQGGRRGRDPGAGRAGRPLRAAGGCLLPQQARPCAAVPPG